MKKFQTQDSEINSERQKFGILYMDFKTNLE